MRRDVFARALFAVVGCVAGCVVGSSAFAAELYNNGPFITNPTGGTGSIAGLPISNADGFTVPGSSLIFSTSGVNASVAANTALADDFVVTGPGWDLDSVTLFAFQTSQTTATVQRIRVNLWTDTPFSAGSPSAPATLPTPVLATSLDLEAGPGTFVAHRQGPSGTSTVRPVFSYTVSLDGLPNAGVLAPGRYWLEWSFQGALSPSQNVFTPLVSPRSAVSGHNARQFAPLSAGAAPVWFEGREGFVAGQSEGRAYEIPFVLSGSVIPSPGATALLAIGALASARRRRS